MASVRAALRAQVDNVYYLYEVLRRVNLMLFRDTKDQEFVTLFYGVLDARTRRLTYSNAGHPPGLLLRDGKLTELWTDNMVLGVNPEEEYKQAVLALHKQMNFDPQELISRLGIRVDIANYQRVERAMAAD